MEQKLKSTGWIPHFECLSCGSTCGKYVRGTEVPYCFVCNATQGDIILTDEEIEKLPIEQLIALVGVEEGTVDKILERLNTPGGRLSLNVKSDNIYIRRFFR